jgi:hypothetical protein
MTQPALATVEALQERLGRTLDGVNATRAQAALDDASALVRSAANKTWVTDEALDADIPDVVVAITLTAARRAFENPNGLASQNIGSYAYTRESAGTPGLFLTADEVAALQLAAGDNGLGSVPAVTPWSLYGSDEYIEVVSSDKPLPYTVP